MTNARDSLEDAVEVQQELERLQVRSDLLGVLVGVGEFFGGHVRGVRNARAGRYGTIRQQCRGNRAYVVNLCLIPRWSGLETNVNGTRTFMTESAGDACRSALPTWCRIVRMNFLSIFVRTC